ncbi:ribonuclease R [Clostridium saccharobutylicum]|uniref:Ribonuclease R n=1 Tax=Clostridium saccharobutylicum TaxID=169679 RepID=A0A1S8NIN3_CLOSA|nr:ribonuclease R [Clostridium saccharobutylicum]OOM16346.1 ribonuclease R [Clostridium saccharobutylicum]
MGIKQTLASFMRETAYTPMDIEELVAIFDIKKNEYNAFKKTLKMMEHEGIIRRTKTNRYMIAEGEEHQEEGLVIGTLQSHAKGFGFLIPEEEGQKDVFIPSNCINGAFNGDKISVKVTREDTKTKKREGRVVEILERNTSKIVGIYEDSKNFGFVVSEDTRMKQDIFISKKDRNNAKDGDVVIVKITKWPDEKRKPEGVVTEILGRKGDRGIDILMIIKKLGLPEEFPTKVLNFAENISEEIDEQEYLSRRDLRDLRMVTIDGEDAKDLDDAVSIEKLPNGNFRLGVHIADVTHYVRESNPLDKEALKRATSVYLIDRVVPMLPRKLSNGICSLNPKVDRLTLTCFMEINNKGMVVDHEIVESIIKTNERMTYTDVTKILRDHDEELIKRYDYLYDDFKLMEELCNILREKRTRRGAIDFEIAEAKIILNELGKPIEIKPYEREIANRMIEEFMLAANETVAEHMFKTKIPFVYRIHENPDEEKLTKFKEFVYNLGYNISWTEEIHPKSFQEILEKVKGKNEETVVSTLLLRSMMQAKYAPACIGHFGLAAQYYCHFTSPIRRYPDLQIHRIIKEYLHAQIDEKRYNRLKNIVGYAAKQSSEMERKAQDAEREVDDLKKAEYMQDRIGEEFEGIISSVTSFGIFVELPSTIEGLVHVNDLNDDYYVFNEAHLSLTGERTKKVYKLGDKVKVECVDVDIANREIFFRITEEPKREDEIADKDVSQIQIK